MTNILGDWKTIAMLTYDENGGILWGDTAYYEAQDDDSTLKLFTVTTRFCEDGRCLNLMPLPEGFTEEMAKAEGLEMIEGKALIEETTWKEENGLFYIDSGQSREILGEALSSFDEIQFEGDTMVLPSMKLERI